MPVRRLVVLGAVVAALSLLTGCASSPVRPATSVTSTVAPDARTANVAVSSSGCGTPDPYPAGRSLVEHLTSGGHRRTYILHVPASYSAATPTPLVLAFHARGGDGSAMERYTGLSDSDSIVAYPDGLVSHGERSWENAPYASGADDVQFVAQLITHLQTKLCVDPDRIAAAGKSNGGGFTALLACRLPDRIAAFGIVSGAFYETASARCSSPVPTPIVEFHGTADPTIHYDGGSSHGVRYQSVPAWLAARATTDGCATGPVTTSAAAGVSELQWAACSGRGALVHYRITGGGHTWPGALADSGPGVTNTAVSATHLMLAFFAAHPLRSS